MTDFLAFIPSDTNTGFTVTTFMALAYLAGFISGIVLTYFLWRRSSKKLNGQLTDLQAVSFLFLTVYLFSPVIPGLPEPNIAIASLLVGLAGGEAIGIAITKGLGKNNAIQTNGGEKHL